MKAKGLFILQLPPPYHGASMANQLLVESSLIQSNFEVRIINLVTAESLESIGRFSFAKVWLSARIFFRILWQLISYRPQIVYFTIAPSGFAFYRDAAYITLIKLFRRKLVIHFHGHGIQAGCQSSALFRFLTKRIFPGTYTIHLSPALAADVPNRSIIKKYIVPNGIPITRSQAPVKAHKQKAVILFLSNYVRTKGILDLIDAIELVVAANTTQFHVRLVGKPADIGLEEVNARIKQKNLGPYITVCGPRYNEEKYAELENADIFVLPTYYANEAFPISLLEAMQYGLAIISTRKGGIPDMIQDNYSGLLIGQRDISALAEKIKFLVNNEEERKKMGTHARQVFLEQYTLSHFEKNMLTALTEVQSSKPT
jgi:Glycosyltransferase